MGDSMNIRERVKKMLVAQYLYCRRDSSFLGMFDPKKFTEEELDQLGHFGEDMRRMLEPQREPFHFKPQSRRDRAEFHAEYLLSDEGQI